ncbi:hypothetical protein D3C87_2041160 [compost metagenome]
MGLPILTEFTCHRDAVIAPGVVGNKKVSMQPRTPALLDPPCVVPDALEQRMRRSIEHPIQMSLDQLRRHVHAVLWVIPEVHQDHQMT